MPAQTTQQYFKVLTILHYALITGVLLFALIAFALQSLNMFGENEELRNVFLYIVPLVALGGVIGGSMMYKKQVNEIKNKNSLAEKLEAYRAIFIMRDALLEGPSLFAIIAYLLTGEILFLALTGSLVAIFILVRPSKDKLAKDLELSSDEMNIINNDDDVIG
jgi:divalent metal cation (Fe/Co/Zn/Cd) transporter